MSTSLFVKSQDGYNFVYSIESGEYFIVLTEKNYSIFDGLKQFLKYDTYNISVSCGITQSVKIVNEDEYRRYVETNDLFTYSEESKQRSLHGFELFKQARAIFNKKESSPLASNELSKLISNARKLKVQELLITFPCMTKRSIENRLRCLSNKYAGVQNTNNLTEKQAIAIIQYVMGFDSELILGNG